MVFSSVFFLLVFLPLFFAVYCITPRRLRCLLLLMGSLFFYAWGEPAYLMLIVTEIVLAWVIAIGIEFALDKDRHGMACAVCALGIFAILGCMAWFKYGMLFAETYVKLTDISAVIPQIALPMGISFYSFQIMSYLWDVYRGKTKALYNPIRLGAYIAMFPQLIAGPIVRLTDVEKDLAAPRVSLEETWEGMMRFICGLGKKVLLANHLAMTAETIFNNPAECLSPGLIWIGAGVYALEIYFDFSGYSDMAIGLGRMLGFRFPENFNYPYISRSAQEFWHRWHMTLSGWFRDYVYIPLGGSRRGLPRTCINQMIVFLLCGLWHGASWNFLIWGAYWGLFLCIERIPLIKRNLPRIPTILRWSGTMAVVLVGWVLFQEGTISTRIDYLAVMFGLRAATPIFPIAELFTPKLLLVLGASVVACVPFVPHLRVRLTGTGWMVIRNLLMLLVLAMCIILLVGGTYNPFIYFRF